MGGAPHAEGVKQLALAIAGMHCANCVGRVEHNLLRVPGVRRATVNLVQERADIEYDSAQTTPEALLAAVNRAGYKGSIWGGIGAQLRRERIEIIRVIVCLLLSAPLLVEMLDHALGWHVVTLSPWLALGLASVVQFWGGAPFYQGAAQALRQRTANMDVLVALGSSIAYGVSCWRVLTDAGSLAFESSALIITFVLLGRWLEAALRRKTMATVHHLVTLQPQEVRRVAAGNETMVGLSQATVGDVLSVWTGERVPLDGDVTAGSATFDYALVTGEAAPRVLEIGDPVIAGTLCLNGSIQFKVTSHAGQTMVDRLADMVAVAQATHAPMQRLADQVAAAFIAAVLALAAFTLLFWTVRSDMGMALQSTLAVLLMACPCALGLAVPMAIAVAVGQAARHGILLRDAAALERAAAVTTVIFDKTGTLAGGVPELAETVGFGEYAGDQVLAYAAALNQKVNHPVAASLRATVKTRNALLPVLIGEPAITFGRGVRGKLQDGTELICGNLQFMMEHAIPLEDAAATAAGWEERGRTLSWVAALTPRPRLLGLLSFRNALRAEAPEVAAQLLKQGIKLSIMSGDNKHTTASVAKRLNITHVEGEALPQDKLQEIQKRRKWGEVVAMVGDGINDAPALAAADLGIVMQSGTDAADAAAPVRLMRDDLRLVPAVLDLARKTRTVIGLNLAWALIFNLVALPFAAMGQVPPYLAALSMTVSSFLVILHSLSLQLWRPNAA